MMEKIRPINIPKSVVFPAPFFPKIPTMELLLTLNEIHFIIFLSSKNLTRFETLIIKLFTGTRFYIY